MPSKKTNDRAVSIAYSSKIEHLRFVSPRNRFTRQIQRKIVCLLSTVSAREKE